MRIQNGSRGVRLGLQGERTGCESKTRGQGPAHDSGPGPVTESAPGPTLELPLDPLDLPLNPHQDLIVSTFKKRARAVATWEVW